MRHQHVICGGTFDRLHRGHRDFLNFVFNLGEKVVIGLTSDKYIEKYKNGKGIEPYETRKKNLEQYLEKINQQDNAEIIPIDDHFGPAITNKYPFQALAVTEETTVNGEKINEKRREAGLRALPLEVFKMTREFHGPPVASTTVREAIFVLPPTLRPLLRDPWGDVIREVPKDVEANKIITVGDVTTKMFMDEGVYPGLSIVDLHIERDHKVKAIQELGFTGNERKIFVKNPAATITPELVQAIYDGLKDENKTLIIIEGEEDLAALPAILAAPLGFTIFYGQPGQGMVRIKITEEIKRKAEDLLERFDKNSTV